MNTTTITINKGNCQFNTTSAKAFRATLAKWHNATFKIADELLAKNDRVKNYRGLITSNLALIDKLNKGEKIISDKSVKVLQSEIDAWTTSIDKENADMTEYRNAQKSRIEEGEKLVDKSIYEEYVATIDTDKTTYVNAIANFLQSNGVAPCTDTINALIASVGKKSASARQSCKSGKHNTTFSFNQWRKIFLGELCDMMGDVLPLYKFMYVLKDNRKKSDK